MMKTNICHAIDDKNEWKSEEAIMDMNLQKYMAFIKTVELGSFTKAALALNYSQSGISRMINDLEKEWGLILLERSRSGLNLTSDGLNVFPLIKKLAEEYFNLQRRVEDLSGLKSGFVRIGTFSSVATHWIPKIIKKFQIDYPSIEFELLLGDYKEIEQWIMEGRVDFGFLRLPTLPELETIFLEQDDVLVVLPKNHSLADQAIFPITHLKNEPFILLEKEGVSDILEIFKKSGFLPDIRYRTWDDYAVMAMVENELGISMLPQLILNRIPYQIVMKELDVPAYRKIGLAYKNKETLSLATKEFLKYIKYRHK